MGLQQLVQIVIGIATIPIAASFYSQCARPSLVGAKAKKPAFLLAQIGTIAVVLAGLFHVFDALGLLPRMSIYLGLALLVLWLPAALAYLRPMWIVRLTGGPTSA